jgi:hypothetical protein
MRRGTTLNFKHHKHAPQKDNGSAPAQVTLFTQTATKAGDVQS